MQHKLKKRGDDKNDQNEIHLYFLLPFYYCCLLLSHLPSSPQFMKSKHVLIMYMYIGSKLMLQYWWSLSFTKLQVAKRMIGEAQSYYCLGRTHENNIKM